MHYHGTLGEPLFIRDSITYLGDGSIRGRDEYDIGNSRYLRGVSSNANPFLPPCYYLGGLFG